MNMVILNNDLIMGERSSHQHNKNINPYRVGHLNRDSRSLDIMGVNIVGRADQMPFELDMANKTFNTVRFRCWRFLQFFMAGYDFYKMISRRIPEGIKLVPILFQGLGEGEMILKLEKEGRIRDWLDFWLQDEFLRKYRYIDVCNEPRTISHPWQRTFLLDMLPRVKDLVKHKGIPVTTGLGYGRFSKDTKLFDDVAPLSDYIDFHFYQEGPRRYVSNLRRAIKYCKTKFNKPIVISEFNLGVSNENMQKYWLANVLHVMKDERIKGYIVHCLREPIPNKYWGIYHRNWIPKKCIELFP